MFMRSFVLLLTLLPVLALAAADNPAAQPTLLNPALDAEILRGGSLTGSKAAVDSVLFIGPWGSGAPHNGQFEDEAGLPAWNGWTHLDVTNTWGPYWQVSDYQAENLNGHGVGNLALWCGELDYPACDTDPDGGYGNNYHEIIRWTGVVADPALATTVTLEAWLNHDLEVGYDYLYLQVVPRDGVPRTIWETDGKQENLNLVQAFQVDPAEYHGAAGLENEVVLQFVVRTDTAWSDEDCLYGTAGACQIDDIAITLGNGNTSHFYDFQDGQLGDWVPTPRPHVGDFSKIWTNLEDIDYCNSNYTPQVAFIDDGVVVPGTGGTFCQTWCYGPGGYIVNNDGGLAGEGYFLHNQILSPVIAWPSEGYLGCSLGFDVYRHEDLSPDSPGIFYAWQVRSVNTGDPGDLEDAEWKDRSFIHFGPSSYYRHNHDVSDLLEPGATHVQMALEAFELGWVWGFVGEDGTPAPYFDNVRLTGYDFHGPAMHTRAFELAGDGFPASGELDLSDPASLSVRFDMANDIAPNTEPSAVMGDSVVVYVDLRRPGASMAGMPQMHYLLKPNPAFDPYRSSGLPSEGTVHGEYAAIGTSVYDDIFAFDLPDEGFLFPGDVLHYRFTATSVAGGEFQSSSLPADTTGFSVFDDPWAYSADFTMRALPSLRSHSGGFFQGPETLVWVDGNDLDTWTASLDLLERELQHHYDLFVTRSPSFGRGNGLGSRATPAQLELYQSLLYTSGNMTSYTLANGDRNGDGSDDLGLLESWLDTGGRTLFLSGDNLCGDLALNAGTQGIEFLQYKALVDFHDSSVRPFINNQITPLVEPTGFMFPLTEMPPWIANGGCPSLNTFDAITPRPGAEVVAEFTDPLFQPGVYPYAAMVWHPMPRAKTVLPSPVPGVTTLPISLASVTSAPGEVYDGDCNARDRLLSQVLQMCGQLAVCGGWGAVEMPEAFELEAASYPNPFNPTTRISYTMPRTGHLSIKVFDLKGRLVRTLLDEQVTAGPGSVTWAGKNENGAEVSSGVYLFQVQGAGKTIVEKMALIK
jgi:hypothetical protein